MSLLNCTSVNVAGKSYDLGLDTLEAMPPERRDELETAIEAAAFRLAFEEALAESDRPRAATVVVSPPATSSRSTST